MRGMHRGTLKCISLFISSVPFDACVINLELRGGGGRAGGDKWGRCIEMNG